MDKLTHTKFNLNNFLLAISNGIDCAIGKNKNGTPYSSQRVAFIALKIASFHDFTKTNLSDILSWIIVSKHTIASEREVIFPFFESEIFNNTILQQIVFVSEMVENNIEIKNNFVLNKFEIINIIEALELDEVGEMIKENFFYLGEMESFWFDIVSPRLPFCILDMLEDTTIEIEYERLLLIGKEVSTIVYKYTQRKFNTTLVENLATMCTIYNFDNKDSSRLLLSGYLHNIGLLKIPQNILLKKEKLTPIEYEIVKGAPYYTQEILSMIFGFDDITKLASNYAEKLDGSGYPYHRSGNELSLKERLLTILCLYQALSEERVYRDAFGKNEIFKILEEDGNRGELDSSVIKDIKATL